LVAGITGQFLAALSHTVIAKSKGAFLKLLQLFLSDTFLSMPFLQLRFFLHLD